jgi:DNA-binding NarL/FixJ family response regulator
MLVDDQEMILAGLRAILETDPEIEVVAQAVDGIGAVREWAAARPDVMLMDLRMPGIDGVEAIRRIRQMAEPSETQIVVLTTFDEDTNVIAAIQAGAGGFLSKGVSPRELIAGIKEAHAGRGTLSPGATAALIRHVVTNTAPAPDKQLKRLFTGLTPREHDVVRALAGGLTYSDIATELSISRFTAKTHAANAMAKVGARDRAQLVAFAIRAGLRGP